jgi:ketosteroid isomerase-like protein
MADRDDLLAWVNSALYEAARAVHNGDAGRALWSRNEPVSVLGAWRNAYGRDDVDEAFTFLERSFSDCTSFMFELQACDVVGDMAYTAGLARRGSVGVVVPSSARAEGLRAKFR